jgi:hypothetical protein
MKSPTCKHHSFLFSEDFQKEKEYRINAKIGGVDAGLQKGLTGACVG